MIYAPQGRIQFTRSLKPGASPPFIRGAQTGAPSVPNAYRLRFAFATDATTYLAVLHLSLDAILERAVVTESLTGVGAWSVYLYDAEGTDVLGGDMASLSFAVATEVPLGANLGADRRGRIEIMGEHELVIDGNGVAAAGLLDLYCLTPRGEE